MLFDQFFKNQLVDIISKLLHLYKVPSILSIITYGIKSVVSISSITISKLYYFDHEISKLSKSDKSLLLLLLLSSYLKKIPPTLLWNTKL